MPHALTPTNMTAEEVIPETGNPAHNPQFWCLPPVRDQPSEDHRGGGYPMYLVSQGKAVGVWHNWTVVKLMVSGHPSGAQRGHHTMAGCIAEWQQHCAVGVHPHPAAPEEAASSQTPRVTPQAARQQAAIQATAGPPKSRGRPVPPGLQTELQLYCMPQLVGLSSKDEAITSSAADDLSSSVSSPSSVTSTEWAAVPEAARYFALWGGRIVYTDRVEAREDFVEAERTGKKPKILSTTNYNEAQAFSEAIYWL
ncbi:hypothetical protein DFH08DRAFT_971799 [Mycena albidolilacea]|uniref:Uncharacterized protein n=1 Tax=Mycena albidolilacea TaxID=1033008 RepID=A0AAD7EES1_9AGAR|nr:hypothetical protein DFH08DRAFT_971799 [Mycena albidolilacea]